MYVHLDLLTGSALAVFAACALFLTGLGGFRLGERRHRHDRVDGWDAGELAERARWESITGRRWDEVAGFLRNRPLPLPGESETLAMEPGDSPFFSAPPEGWEDEEPPPTGLLLAQADDLLAGRDSGELPAFAPGGLVLGEPGEPSSFDAGGVVSAGGGLALGEQYAGPAALPYLSGVVHPPVRGHADLALIARESAAFLARVEADSAVFLARVYAEGQAFLAAQDL